MTERWRGVSCRNHSSISRTICWCTSSIPHAHTWFMTTFYLSLYPTVWKVASHLCKCALHCRFRVCDIPGIDPKVKILSSFTHPQVLPNLSFLLLYFFHSMVVSGFRQLFSYQHSSKYLLLCSTEERKGFGTTWGWVNYDSIFILGWTIPLRCVFKLPPSLSSLTDSSSVKQTPMLQTPHTSETEPNISMFVCIFDLKTSNNCFVKIAEITCGTVLSFIYF